MREGQGTLGAQSWGCQPVQVSGSHRQGFLEEVKLRTGLKKEQESDSRRVWKAILGGGAAWAKAQREDNALCTGDIYQGENTGTLLAVPAKRISR